MMFVIAAAEIAAVAPFDRMASLTGEWRSVGTGQRPIKVDYRSISNGSAIVEAWQTASGRETMTMYFVDKGAILATHYCGQGNQATLRSEAGSAPAERLDFRFASATGVDPGEGVLVGLTLVISHNRLQRIETYRTDGIDSVQAIEFERTSPA